LTENLVSEINEMFIFFGR